MSHCMPSIDIDLCNRFSMDSLIDPNTSAFMLTSVGLADYLDTPPNKMSGGQRQRVAVARALASGPGLILADEPTAALDRQSGQDVVRLMRDLARQSGMPILLVTHDPRILDIADRVVSMEDGRILAETT